MTKFTWFFVLAVLATLCLVFTPSATYAVAPSILAPSAEILTENDILRTAQGLVNQYGIRPPYHGPKFAPGEAMTLEQAIYASAYLIACESQNRDIQEPDSNGLMSRGRAQFQDATWAEFSEESGISGNPMEPNKAIAMMLWALEHGGLNNWTCATIEGILN